MGNDGLAMTKVSDSRIDRNDGEAIDDNDDFPLSPLFVNDEAINILRCTFIYCDVHILKPCENLNSINADPPPRIEIITALFCREDLFDIRFKRVSRRVSPPKGADLFYIRDTEIISLRCCKNIDSLV